MSSNAPAAVVRAELTKIGTVRSSLVPLLIALVVSVGIGVLNGASARSAIDRNSSLLRPDFNPVDAGFVGVQFGQLALIAFAALMVCTEYGSGMIRTSLAAVPSRGLLYLAKITAAATVALLVAVPTAFLAFLASQRALGPHGVGLGHPGALRAVLGACLYLTLMCLFSLGVATMLRSTALALSLLFAFVFVLSPVANAVPALRSAARYLPDHAGAEVMKADPSLGPGTGLLVLAAWAAAALLAGYLTLRSRDS
ncbi:ABC transporter permease [Kitasatospora sp. NPDC097691]|uniref:ABC transporter permease n=1 Tax=Kitasatospora sp. NPDC097691 TaxID=3157231 RepID=UPI00331FBCD9